ncbi:hypothetical protein LLE49_26855 [Alicyclobacillus tolerans]|uniref:hypothetical protein n=1 Tax=Alicyclobacillus tolerans TaxID=90970 RepID=UPI001F1D0399|nr:hypothetical protein [Alicyclobacillus tolerans]MCF8568345.1 hypothetical protein [Alicyclobacillus tolerans]
MGLFKILGGAALGVAAVAAAPVFGAVGVVTLTGAAVGASVGAAAGGAASSKEKKKKQASERASYERGKAERAAEFEDLQTKFSAAAKRFKSHKKYEEFLVAAFAVAISVAHADGAFTTEERVEIQEIVSGESYNALPQEIRNEIQKLFMSPPTFNTAMTFVQKVDKSKWSMFDSIIDLVIAADGAEHENERAFRAAWQQFKAS